MGINTDPKSDDNNVYRYFSELEVNAGTEPKSDNNVEMNVWAVVLIPSLKQTRTMLNLKVFFC